VSRAETVQRIAESLIRASSRRLGEEERAERRKEWSAELPAILDDTSIRPPVVRFVRALTYSAGLFRTTRYLRQAGGRSPRARTPGWRNGAMPVRPTPPARGLTIGLIVWLVVIFAVVSFLRAHPDPGRLPAIIILTLAAAFDSFCLVDIARAPSVRYLPKWAWVLVCLAQTPSGGIVYLSVGRARPIPPSPAQRS
jgi:hypothetical protein